MRLLNVVVRWDDEERLGKGGMECDLLIFPD